MCFHVFKHWLLPFFFHLEAVVAASVSLAAGSCAHALVFYLAMWLTDIATKCKAFLEACRGVARLQPCEYPGGSTASCECAHVIHI